MPLPVISDIPALTQWRTAISNNLRVPITPRIPFNFTVASQQGGNLLNWTPVNGSDGYQIDKSPTGNFADTSTVQTVSLTAQQASSYFDATATSQGASPATIYYRMRATAGTLASPQSVVGLNTGVLSSKAIAPNDTTTASTTSSDVTTTDKSQQYTGRGGSPRLPRD